MHTTKNHPASGDAPRVGQGGEVYLRIGEAAERTGLTQRTIRYYEELGLLSPPGRTQGDFRLFSATDLQRLEQISRLKKLLGFSLAEIKKLVEGEEAISVLRSEYRATESSQTRLALLNDAVALTEAQLELLETKMAQLAEMQTELRLRCARYKEKRRELEDNPSVTHEQKQIGHDKGDGEKI